MAAAETLYRPLLRPRGSVARLCEGFAAARPSASPEAVYAAVRLLVLRVTALLFARGRGLLPPGPALNPETATWPVLHELLPAAPLPGDCLGAEEARLLDPALLAATLRELTTDAASGAPIDYGALPVRLLGTLYEELAGRRLIVSRGRLRLALGGGRASGGVYYTPEPIVGQIVEATVGRTLAEHFAPVEREVRELLAGDAGETEPGRERVERLLDGFAEAALGLRVCDPAMGCGFFLLAAAERIAGFIAETQRLAPWRPPRPASYWRRLAAERCLFGADIDSLPAAIARLSLWLACAGPRELPPADQARLLSGESLLGVAWERLCPGGFDAVIGNPPWGAELPAGARLRAAYRSAAGEPESAALFTELALRIAGPGGRVGLVTPNTWLTLVRQAELRRLVLETSQVELLAELAPGSFRAVRSIVPLVFVLRRGRVEPPEPTRVLLGGHERSADQRAWRAAPALVMDMRRDGVTGRALATIDACSQPLGALARVCYGIKTGDNAANLAREPLTPEHRPALVSGPEIRRHEICWAGGYLRYGRHLSGYRRGPVEVPKIVVQYIRNLSLPRRIVAAVDERGRYYPLNNFSFVATPSDGYDLFYLAALLCSSTLNAVFAARFRDYNIKPAYLRQLPIRRIAFTTPPPERAELLRRCERLPAADVPGFAGELLRSGRADVLHDLLALLARGLAEGEWAGGAFAETDRLIDALAARLYGLDEAEIGALAGV